MSFNVMNGGQGEGDAGLIQTIDQKGNNFRNFGNSSGPNQSKAGLIQKNNLCIQLTDRIHVLKGKVKVLDQGLGKLSDKQNELTRVVKDSSLIINGKIDSLSTAVDVKFDV